MTDRSEAPTATNLGLARWAGLALGANAREAAQTYGALGALALLILYNAIFNASTFLTVQSFRNNSTQVATIVIVAIGMTFVIATGGIDLSVGSLMAISGALAPLIFLAETAPFSNVIVGNLLAYLLPVLAAATLGLFNGALVTAFRIQPIIATLVLFIAGRGFAQVITNGQIQTFKEPGWQKLGLGRVLGIPVQVILMLAIVAIAAWVMRTTTFGRHVLAIGGNEAAARLSGVPVARVKLVVYAISGTLAGIAGLIAIAIVSSSDANLVGSNIELDAIAAVAVGGTPLIGGRASMVGTLIGALILQLIRTTLLTEGVPDGWARVITATTIVIAVLIQRRQGT